MSSLTQKARPARPRSRLAVASLACLLLAGQVMAMPVHSADAVEGSGGTLVFSGAIVAGTCAVPSSPAAELPGNAPVRGQCQSGASRPTYRARTNEIGEHPGSRLLQYAKAAYGNAKVVTYVYE